MSKIVYLDNAATTKIDTKVLQAMMPFFADNFGNASSLHFAGIEAKKAIDSAKRIIADFLACQPEEIYFTSGATESDNLAIFGLLSAIEKKISGFKPHIITTQIEHEAVLEPFKVLKNRGWDVDFVSVDEGGLIDLAALKKMIKPETVFLSVMYANNEIGTIQPIVEIGKLLAELNSSRKNKIYFHTDAVQAAAYCEMNVVKLGVDLLSFSGHKIYGPKGIGVLYLKKSTPFSPMFWGGHQQGNIRPGTYNSALIVGMAKAVEMIKKNRISEIKKIKTLRDYLIKNLLKKIKYLKLSGDIKKRLPNNASFLVKGVEGESILLMLSQKNIAVSTGSACSSGSLDPSHVLLAMGIKKEDAHGSLRITIGRHNNKSDIDKLIKSLPPIIDRLRSISPIKLK